MRLMLAIGIAGVAAALLLASASAGPPFLLPQVATTHEQPVAGRLFTGLTITPNQGARIIDVHCNAKAGRNVLRGRLQRFYAPGGSGAVAVACSWQVPANASGKLLRGIAYVLTTSANNFLRSGSFSWHIKP